MSATTVLESNNEQLTVILGIGNKTVVATQNGDTAEGVFQRAAAALGLDLNLKGKQILGVPRDGSPARVIEPTAPVSTEQAVVLDERRHNG